MKKNLRELFDKATPEELDAFADDLDSSDLPPDVLASVKHGEQQADSEDRFCLYL